MEYLPVSSVNPDIEATKAAIRSANEIKNKGTIAEFPTKAGRTKKNNDSKRIIKDNVEARFLAMIK
ncbi:hypothetical protein HYS72_02735 [Candidatus Pacearchaeota archaeon]|nr:hypothetical protein [Candidatus Pacearchaeota archaeon]